MAGADGFDLETITEDSRDSHNSRNITLYADDRNEVWVSIYGDDGPSPVYVAPALPIAALVAHVRLPDGRTALEAGATIKTRCYAALLGKADSRDLDADVPGVLTDIPIEVTVKLDGYAPYRASCSN